MIFPKHYSTLLIEKGQVNMEGIISSIIVGGLALVGVIFSNVSSNKKVEHQILTSQEVMKTEILALKREVEKLTGVSAEIPVIKEQIKVINHRLDDLEKERK